MPEDSAGEGAAKESGVARANASADKAITQIREVAKWLIGAFAAVAVVLAAGSQLSEVGSLEDERIIVAGLAILATLFGVVLAIYFTVKVLTPKSLTLRRAVLDEENGSPAGQAVAEDPTLLLGHGKSIKEFEERRNAALAREEKAWAAYEGDRKSEELKAEALRAMAERERIDEAMTWVISFARSMEATHSFKVGLRAMLAGAAIAALGITGFAWAAHPEEEKEESAAVAKAPSAIAIELSAAGSETLADDVGAACDRTGFRGVAIGGEPEALEVITTPTRKCEVARFVLTPELGTYESEEPVLKRSNPGVPSGAG